MSELVFYVLGFHLSIPLVNSYGLNGMGTDAVELFRRIPHEMIVDQTYTCVLNACSHSALVEEARAIFSNIPVKTKWTYTPMVLRHIDVFNKI